LIIFDHCKNAYQRDINQVKSNLTVAASVKTPIYTFHASFWYKEAEEDAAFNEQMFSKSGMLSQDGKADNSWFNWSHQKIDVIRLISELETD
jgi:hypothetical protein